MKIIPLTKGKSSIVDDEDYEFLMQWEWFFNLCYAGRHIEIGKCINNKRQRKRIYMHRLIMNCPAGMEIDHINGNGLDNRKCNLRIVTIQQNQWNSNSKRDSTSKYKGVHWHKNKKNWQANIKINNKYIYLGSFPTQELAYAAYCKASKYRGEFARAS